MFLGQSACHQCMRVQIPFYLKSGLLIDEALDELGISKRQCLTFNVVACHPCGSGRGDDHDYLWQCNRPSFPYEQINCRPFLLRTIEIVQPKIIVCFGRDAAEAILSIPRFGWSTQYRTTIEIGPGRRIIWDGEVVPMYHPAYIVRRAEKKLKGIWTDRLVEVLEEYA